LIKTEWKCEHCEKSGIIEIPNETGFWEGLRMVAKAHKKASPSCDGSFTENIRVKLIEEKTQK